jgi:hypothetical protein
LALAIFVQRATPGPPSQDILGVGIGNYYSGAGVAYLSGRRLSCVSLPAEDPFTSICTVSIAGKPLEIRARRNPPADPMQLGGACEAIYDGQQWPCRVGSRHVQVHWFAYIDDPLGWADNQRFVYRERHGARFDRSGEWHEGAPGPFLVYDLESGTSSPWAGALEDLVVQPCAMSDCVAPLTERFYAGSGWVYLPGNSGERTNPTPAS